MANTRSLLRYGAPFLFNGTWFLGTYFLLPGIEHDRFGYGIFTTVGISLLLGFLLNLILCVANFIQGKTAVGYIYLFIIVAFFLLLRQFIAIFGNMKFKVGA